MAIKSIQSGTLTIRGVETIDTKILPVVIANSTLEWDGTAVNADGTPAEKYNGVL